MQRHHTKFAIIAFWTLFLVGCGPSGCGGSDPAVPPAPTPTPVTYQERLYVSESGLNRVEQIDLTTGKSLATIAVGTQPTKMVYDHHSRNGYDNQDDPTAALWVLNAGTASVTRVDPRADVAVTTIAIGGSPIDIAAAQNTSGLLYVADGQSNSIAIVSENSNSIVGHITTAGRPFQISANAAVLMVAEANNTVEVFDDTKLSTAPATTITTTSALRGVGTYYDTDPAIETADGILHIYKTANVQGGLPWTDVADYTLPHGAGQLDAIAYDDYMVINAGAQMVQYASFDPNDNKTQEHDMATGAQPGFGDTGDSGPNGYFYVPNSGGDSMTVYWQNWLPFATWPLAAGSHPIEAVTVRYAQAPSPTPSPTPTTSPTATPTPTPTSTPAATQHLYVANGSGKNVLVYNSPFGASSAPAVNVNIGEAVWGVAANSNYVAVEDNVGFIYIFNAPLTAGASPVAQFQGGAQAGQLYFDSNGNLYTAIQGSGVLEYSPPFTSSSTPVKTIFGDTSSFSLTMDYNNNLYVGNLGRNQIDIFASPYTGSPVSVPQPGTYGLASYATYLFGADAGSAKIDVYNLPMNSSSTPAFTIANADPHGLAADVSTGTLYVGDQHGGGGSGSIDVYNQPLSGSSTPAFSITSGVTEPVQVWIGP